MMPSEQVLVESDPRFPSGPWTGFFLHPAVPGRHLMELHLTFRQGQINGEGRDYVGNFILRGQYCVVDGKCHWTKRYVGKHDVFYQGYNEGKGIWGVWEIPATRKYGEQRGGFRIWPEGMSDPTLLQLAEEAEIPNPASETVENEERVAEPVGSARSSSCRGRTSVLQREARETAGNVKGSRQ
jgi:hypothetical protein